jgi:hypothetical protein
MLKKYSMRLVSAVFESAIRARRSYAIAKTARTRTMIRHRNFRAASSRRYATATFAVRNCRYSRR